MKPLEKKRQYRFNQNGIMFSLYFEKDLREHLNRFYSDYWKKSKTGDKCKKYIICDDLDYLLNKHFGKLIDIKTLQKLKNE